MRVLLIGLGFLCLACTGYSKPRPGSEEEKAKAILQGRWSAIESGGERKWSASITGSTLELTQGGGFRILRYSFRLKPSENPAAIDLVLEKDVLDESIRKPGARYEGIYKLKKDNTEFTICFSGQGSRPKEFNAKQGTLFVLTKEKG